MPKSVASGRSTSKGKGGSDRRVTLAGRKLRKLLDRTVPKTSIETFARQASLTRMAVQRVMNGERWRHVDVNVAVAIRDAAAALGVRIDIEDFTAITAVPVDDLEQDDPPRVKRTGTDG